MLVRKIGLYGSTVDKILFQLKSFIFHCFFKNNQVIESPGRVVEIDENGEENAFENI